MKVQEDSDEYPSSNQVQTIKLSPDNEWVTLNQK